MTEKEKFIISAYTGIIFCDEVDDIKSFEKFLNQEIPYELFHETVKIYTLSSVKKHNRIKDYLQKQVRELPFCQNANGLAILSIISGRKLVAMPILQEFYKTITGGIPSESFANICEDSREDAIEALRILVKEEMSEPFPGMQGGC